MTTVIASIIALFATCAAAQEPPDDRQPPDDIQEGQHWCCHSVDHKTLSGEGCVPISGEAQIAVCNKVLYCNGNWTKDDGKVICD